MKRLLVAILLVLLCLFLIASMCVCGTIERSTAIKNANNTADSGYATFRVQTYGTPEGQ